MRAADGTDTWETGFNNFPELVYNTYHINIESLLKLRIISRKHENTYQEERYAAHDLIVRTAYLQVVCPESKTVRVHLYSMTSHLSRLIAQSMTAEILDRITHRIAWTLYFFTVEKCWNKVYILYKKVNSSSFIASYEFCIASGEEE